MFRLFKYRIYPTKAQIASLEEQLETHRRLYNQALTERRDVFKENGRGITFFEQNAGLTKARQSNEWLKRCNAASLQATLRRLDKAFQNFFRRIKDGGKPGYPRFKQYGRLESVEFPQYGNGVKVKAKSGRLYFQFIGEIKIKLHRPIEGTIKTVTFKREADHWYAVFSCELPDIVVPPSLNPPVGIDLGLKSFLVTSDGEAVEPPKHFQKSEKKLAKLQRRMSRKKKGSKNRHKARLKVARLHRKIANQRRDFHHKTALDLVQKHGDIAHEKLNVKGIARTRLAKSTYDAGWAQFLSILARKAEEAGVQVLGVDPRNTTQRCSRCGRMPDARLTLADRTHKCGGCKQVLDRDWNAARNILLIALGREPSFMPVDEVSDLDTGYPVLGQLRVKQEDLCVCID